METSPVPVEASLPARSSACSGSSASAVSRPLRRLSNSSSSLPSSYSPDLAVLVDALVEGEVVGEVTSYESLGPGREGELLGGKLADRLEHPVALARETEQALLDERLQRVEVGVSDFFGGVHPAASSEDRDGSEGTPFRFGQQVVTPRHGRSEGLLPGVGVPSAPEQIEALRQAF
jgi:hypothetical protein